MRCLTLPSIAVALVGWRFWTVVSLMGLGALMCLETGGAGPLVPSQWLFSLAVSFVVMSTVAWDWKVLGNPRLPTNFIIHVLFFVALTCVLMRVRGEVGPPTNSLLGMIGGLLDWANNLVGLFPPALFEMLRSPGSAMLFIAVVLALCLRRDYALGILVSVALLGLAVSLTQESFGPRTWFIAGLACLGVALWLQYEPPDHRLLWEQVKRRWDGDSHVRGDLEIKYRLLKRMVLEGRPLAEQECLARVGRALGKSPEDEAVRLCTTRAVGQLVRDDNICQVLHGPSGLMLGLSPTFEGSEPDGFTRIATMPKSIIACVVALIWIISPIDLIPDNLPVVGVLDDVAVGVLTAGMILKRRQISAWKHLKETTGSALSV